MRETSNGDKYKQESDMQTDVVSYTDTVQTYNLDFCSQVQISKPLET